MLYFYSIRTSCCLWCKDWTLNPCHLKCSCHKNFPNGKYLLLLLLFNQLEHFFIFYHSTIVHWRNFVGLMGFVFSLWLFLRQMPSSSRSMSCSVIPLFLSVWNFFLVFVCSVKVKKKTVPVKQKTTWMKSNQKNPTFPLFFQNLQPNAPLHLSP